MEIPWPAATSSCDWCVEHPGSHHLERITSAIAVLILGQPIDRLHEGVGDRGVGFEVGQHLLMPAPDGDDKVLPDLLLPLRDAVNPTYQRLLGITPVSAAPDVKEPLHVSVDRQKIRKGSCPALHVEPFKV